MIYVRTNKSKDSQKNVGVHVEILKQIMIDDECIKTVKIVVF